MEQYVVAAFYKFAPIDRLEKRRNALREVLSDAGIIGTVLMATEGVNGTIAGSKEGIEAAVAAIRALPGCEDADVKLSTAITAPFEKLKIKIKPEIVTFKVPEADPTVRVGAYVAPEDWNEFISDPDTVVIDTRNGFEFDYGTFEGAVDPETERFTDFPEWFRKFHAETPAKRYAMFCTGGIRCEKATAFLKSEGVEEVYHLKGGILKYLEDIPEEESLWKGECFVFDERVAIGHGLKLSENVPEEKLYRPRPIQREKNSDKSAD